jgi:two-component system cell cycle sensor histidine kinase/response regulator CckA
MGGRLWAHSEPGKGASFRIYLPRVELPRVELPRVQAAPVQAERGVTPPVTILLMEHNDGLRTVVSNILKKRGYRVLSAGAATEALEMARTEGPLDLLIGDPEPDLVKRLAAVHPGLRTLFLNGHSDHGGVPVLSKPFEVDALVGKVRELLRG